MPPDSPSARTGREQPPTTPRCTTSTSAAPGIPILVSQAAGPQAWERCCGLLREAVVDSGSMAAALVPLRPSLRRIKDDMVRLLDEAVTSQNGNASLLVLGPPGAGKTLVIERALQEVCNKYNGPIPAATTAPAAAAATTAPLEAEAAAGTAAAPTADAAGVAASVRNVSVVRLNGLLQPDERTAFQEVARQLCRDFGQRFIKSATFDENLVFLKGMLHALYKCLKKVVFVVDEFQQYAKRGKQQMLYYLLDMLQDSKIQAAVIGISSVHNVAEDLEKRVLSRVGRRRVLVTFPAPDEGPAGTAGGGPPSPGGSGGGRSPGLGPGSSTGAAATDGAVDSYDGLLYDMLALHPGMAALVGITEEAAEAHNEAVRQALYDSRIAASLSKLALIGAPPQHLALAAEAALAAWGEDLRRLVEQQPAQEQGKGKGPAQQGPRAAAAVMFGSHQLAAALRAVADAPERTLVEAVSGLPVLSLVLLVAAHRLQRKGQSICNFEMAWDEYRSIQGQRGAIAFSKEAAAAAWQGLPLSGLAHYMDGNIESRGRDLSYAGVVLLVGYSELDAGIREHPHCPDAIARFHMQEI